MFQKCFILAERECITPCKMFCSILSIIYISTLIQDGLLFFLYFNDNDVRSIPHLLDSCNFEKRRVFMGRDGHVSVPLKVLKL